MKLSIYYKTELARLKDSKNIKSIKLFDGLGNSTKEFNLNTDSLPLVIEFLQTELKTFKRKVKKWKLLQSHTVELLAKDRL